MTDQLRQRPGDQPLPTPNDRPHIHDLVAADIQARKELGTRRYGTPLQPHNGRDALRDAYEELLDGACYIRQEIEERASRETALRQDIALLAQNNHGARWICVRHGIEVPPTPAGIRARATGGGPCEVCQRPRNVHVCLSCSTINSPDDITPGPGCHNCRTTGWDQTPCKPPEPKP